MRYIAVAETDVGISKNTNEDSVLIKHAKCNLGEILLAIVCDGLGGLDKGELASATVIREFARWFDEELPFELENLNMQIMGEKWALLIKDLNVKMLEYGYKTGKNMGTTFTGLLMIEDKYMIGHVGDTRVYYINNSIKQLTTDQTYVAREIRKGTLTVEEAKIDKRRNMLLQCVGASSKVEPDIIQGVCEKGTYMLCSDGFRHKITEDEIYGAFCPMNLTNKEAMYSHIRRLIDENKRRKEKDNISTILIKAY